MTRAERQSAEDVDIVVVGSGAAGLTAALAARSAGARVALLEAASTIGGTTAVSGGVIWIPNNHHMAAAGLADSPAEAVTYIERLSDGRSSRSLIEAFVAAAPAAIRFLEEASALRCKLLRGYADYHAELPGGKPAGRSLDSGLFDTRELGPWQGRLRQSPLLHQAAMSVTEFVDWKVTLGLDGTDLALVGSRVASGIVGFGEALAGTLLKAVLDRGVEPALETAVRGLVFEDDRVAGVRAVHGGAEQVVRARRGVIFATGGFEWNRELCARFLGGPLTHPASAPCSRGDGLAVLMAAGASLGNMTEAWWTPTVAVPDERYDGAPLYRMATLRSLPHSMIVNRAGQRFVNESINYNDLMKACFAFDPGRYERTNLPAWMIFDASYAAKYPVVTTMPGQPVPAWIPSGATLRELAGKIGVDAAGLEATAARFNRFAAEGKDLDFQRGEHAYDRVYCDPRAASPCLGPIERGPFYAVEIHPGALGTKGGALVDGNARVLRPDGQPIAGLYAAGNAMAGYAGAGYPGAGATLGGAVTFGFLAGRHAGGAA